MSIKRYELDDPESCLNKAADDEPIFVLRAQDALAAGIVRAWADWATLADVSSAKTEEAYRLADEMDAWPTKKTPD